MTCDQVTDYSVKARGSIQVDIPARHHNWTGSGITLSPIQWLPKADFLELKRRELEAGDTSHRPIAPRKNL